MKAYKEYSMKSWKIRSIIILTIAMMVVPGRSQIDNDQTIIKAGTTAAQFLKIGVDARSSAMGNASVALPGDVSSIFWNPGGLANIKGIETQFTNSEWLAGMNFTYIAIAVNYPGIGVLGLSVNQLKSPEEPVRTVIDPEGTGAYWDASDFALTLTFARRLSDRFSLGGNVKFIQQRIWHSRAQTIALDLGALFLTPFNNIRLGAAISNYGGDMQMDGRDLKISVDPDPFNQGTVEFVNALYETERFPLPLLFRVGLAGELFQTDLMRLSFGIDAIHPNDNLEAVNAGLEYALFETFFIRTGYANLFRDDSEEGLAFGGGLHYRLRNSSVALKIDYSYTDFSALGGIPRVSIGVSF